MTETMKCVVHRVALLDVLRGMQCILDKRQDSAPIRMFVENSQLFMTISDGAIFIESSIDVVVSDFQHELQEIYLPVATLYDLIRKLEVEKLEFQVSDKTVVLQYQEGCFSFAKIISITNYVRSCDLNEPQVQINPQTLLDAVRMVKTTMAVEDIRDQFKGISVIIEENCMTLWSTDGLKMCIAKLPVNYESKTQGIWPRKFIDTLLTMNNDLPIELQMSERHVRCKIGRTIVLSPLVNAKLLDHRNIINENSQPDIIINCDGTVLQKKLDRIMILADSEGSVLFETSHDQIKISCSNKQKSDSAFEMMGGTTGGDSGKFYVNPYIIINFVRNFKSAIQILFYSKNNVILIRKKDEQYPVYITKAMVIKNVSKP